MKTTKSFAILVALAVAIMAGCHHTTPMTKTTPPPPTVTTPSPTATLTVTPDTVDQGHSAQLTWNTANATTVNIEGLGTVPASGSRKVTPPSSTTYHLTASGAGGNTDASARITVNVPTTTTTSQLTDEQLFAQNVKDVFFSYDNFEIQQNELQIVSTDADFLAQHPNMKFVIEGHCDERGSEDYNMGLGENRASTVKDTLIKHGVSPDRIKVISYGKEKPFCTTTENESCWQQNRRAHFAFSN